MLGASFSTEPVGSLFSATLRRSCRLETHFAIIDLHFVCRKGDEGLTCPLSTSTYYPLRENEGREKVFGGGNCSLMGFHFLEFSVGVALNTGVATLLNYLPSAAISKYLTTLLNEENICIMEVISAMKNTRRVRLVSSRFFLATNYSSTHP